MLANLKDLYIEEVDNSYLELSGTVHDNTYLKLDLNFKDIVIPQPTTQLLNKDIPKDPGYISHVRILGEKSFYVLDLSRMDFGIVRTAIEARNKDRIKVEKSKTELCFEEMIASYLVFDFYCGTDFSPFIKFPEVYKFGEGYCLKIINIYKFSKTRFGSDYRELRKVSDINNFHNVLNNPPIKWKVSRIEYDELLSIVTNHNTAIKNFHPTNENIEKYVKDIPKIKSFLINNMEDDGLCFIVECN